MKIILSRDIRNLGKVGDVVVVKNGYGRNFLLPKKYAVVATKENIAKLQERINELKEKNSQLINIAEQIKVLLDKSIFNIVRQASDDDTIYGSIRAKDVYNFINDILKKNNISFKIDIGGIKITDPIKVLGRYIIVVEIFGDVISNLRINVCRASADFDENIDSFDKKKDEKSAIVEKAKKEEKKVEEVVVLKSEENDNNNKKENIKKKEPEEKKSDSKEEEIKKEKTAKKITKKSSVKKESVKKEKKEKSKKE